MVLGNLETETVHDSAECAFDLVQSLEFDHSPYTYLPSPVGLMGLRYKASRPSATF
jgi:hypothetical protein